MDTGDLVLFAVVAGVAYLVYQHSQQSATATLPAAPGPTGPATGSVVHQCPQDYYWVDYPGAGGACVPKGNA